MKKLIFILSALVLLAGCKDKDPIYIVDKDLQQKIFMECLKSVPPGPRATVSNDWAEVVSECGSQAYSMASHWEFPDKDNQ